MVPSWSLPCAHPPVAGSTPCPSDVTNGNCASDGERDSASPSGEFSNLILPLFVVAPPTTPPTRTFFPHLESASMTEQDQRRISPCLAPSLPDGGTEGLRPSLPCAPLTRGTRPYKALITHQLCRLVGPVSQAVSSQGRGHARSAR